MASTVANSAVDIAARALTLIGANPITSFSDTSTEATVANNMYEDVAQAALCASRWRFATNQAVLNLLTDAPTGRFDRAYQLPSDMLMLHALTVNDLVVEYTVYGDKAYADLSATDQVVADYSFRANEQDWPSYFTLTVEYQLAAIFASSIARDEALTKMMDDKASMLMAKARNLDSQQQTTRKLVTNRFRTERLS
tara:strand:+ start:4022 stop:4609 length:588 start_codon:yes stop_codon:yes gene_type:complete